MRECVLNLDGVEKSYRQGNTRLEVLRGLNLEVLAGETVALMAPSGAGKTTLLQIAGLLDRPDSGVVHIGSERASDLPDAGRSRLRSNYIGFVFQSHRLLPEFTAEENVVLPQRILGRDKSEAKSRARELLVKMGLNDRMVHHPSALSGGEQQRVAIARALANEPRLILADEPTGNLDGDTAWQVADVLIQQAKESGLGVLIATHNPDLAARLDRTVHLRNGTVG
ncbi:MAG: ABC transporter ATP-binding protein [Alphaproteobacteria bacterium]